MALSWPSVLFFTPVLLLLIVVLAAGGRQVLGGARAAAAGLDWPLTITIAVVGATVIVGWVATTLATTGWFSLPLLTGVIALAVGALGILFWRRHSHPTPRLAAVGWQEWGLGFLLLAALLFYARPHEYVLGGADAGVYVNMANQIARTGAIVAEDGWTALLSDYPTVTLRAQPPQWLPHYLQFVGWYIDDANPARTVPQFFPFHPALLAVGVGLAGPAGALYITPLWGILNIAALYFLARQLCDKNIALTASAFLTVTATQIFFARYPTTEPLTMLLLFTALLAFQIVWDERDAPWQWGVLAGAALGAALLTRIDLPLVLGFFILGALVRWWQRRWNGAWSAFVAILALFMLQLAWIIWQINWPYFYNTYTAVFALLRADRNSVMGAGLLALLALIAVTWLRPTALVNRLAVLSTHPATRWSLAAAVVALSAYAYFLRPVLEPPRELASWPANTTGLLLNGQNWLRMGWYLTPLGIFLATIGLAIILIRGALPRMTVVLGIGVLTTMQYVYNILNAHYHIYAMRRYVPLVIPLLLLFAAVGALAFPLLQRRWITYGVRGACVLGLAAGLLYQSRFVLPQQDFAGTLERLVALDQALAPDAIVLVAESPTAVFGDAFGPALQHIFGRTVATVRADTEQTAAFLDELMAAAAAENRPLQLLAVDTVLPAVRDHVQLLPAGQFTVATTMLMNVFDGFPSTIQPVNYGIEIYDIAPAPVSSPASELFIDVGALDAAFLGEGFFAKEPAAGEPTYRWTSSVATAYFPTGGDGALEVRAMRFLPPGVAAQPVQVMLGEVPIGAFTPTDDWQTFTFTLPATATVSGATSTLKFEVDPFVPAEAGFNNDMRSLGVMIDWLRWRPATGASE